MTATLEGRTALATGRQAAQQRRRVRASHDARRVAITTTRTVHEDAAHGVEFVKAHDGGEGRWASVLALVG